ncbi:hypothetical protein L6452_31948 [Arctium lappa]|uniref:Uncharacterized protein n=1 Tax=Arctium lappa TaxID=4217 RepID=A0ACB8Z4H5_ARCLA|nr:hypothetical protein L6452_31948 [Arctium lappa]
MSLLISRLIHTHLDGFTRSFYLLLSRQSEMEDLFPYRCYCCYLNINPATNFHFSTGYSKPYKVSLRNLLDLGLQLPP